MENKIKFRPNPNLRLMDQVRQVLRYHHYSLRTEKTYCDWIARFIRFHKCQIHPSQMGKNEIEAFLSNLATDLKVSSSTQRQALNAIIFLYRQVLDIEVSDQLEPIKARKYNRPPVVMTKNEVRKVLQNMSDTHLLMAKLLYGCGLRLMECVQLRVLDVDFDRNLVYVRGAKGGKDRVVNLPVNVKEELKNHIARVKDLHDKDILDGCGEVYIPEALARKYPNAAKEFRWKYVFPSRDLSADPRSGIRRRHHVLESGLQKAVKTAVEKSGITKKVSCHTFRHSFATHLLENGINIRIVQELMGHSDVKTTEIYTHVMEKDISRALSPIDSLWEV
ncbi:integron integrase [Desulforegula conservatrix]|uniref:integron integrase n=1 Tax=Desulforegula conservatrix TaxID=153026 RepID=UPI0003FA7C22|nr:integron integrase [Desulforegula conservatrix]